MTNFKIIKKNSSEKIITKKLIEKDSTNIELTFISNTIINSNLNSLNLKSLKLETIYLDNVLEYGKNNCPPISKNNYNLENIGVVGTTIGTPNTHNKFSDISSADHNYIAFKSNDIFNDFNKTIIFLKDNKSNKLYSFLNIDFENKINILGYISNLESSVCIAVDDASTSLGIIGEIKKFSNFDLYYGIEIGKKLATNISTKIIKDVKIGYLKDPNDKLREYWLKYDINQNTNFNLSFADKNASGFNFSWSLDLDF